MPRAEPPSYSGRGAHGAAAAHRGGAHSRGRWVGVARRVGSEAGRQQDASPSAAVACWRQPEAGLCAGGLQRTGAASYSNPGPRQRHGHRYVVGPAAEGPPEVQRRALLSQGRQQLTRRGLFFPRCARRWSRMGLPPSAKPSGPITTSHEVTPSPRVSCEAGRPTSSARCVGTSPKLCAITSLKTTATPLLRQEPGCRIHYNCVPVPPEVARAAIDLGVNVGAASQWLSHALPEKVSSRIIAKPPGLATSRVQRFFSSKRCRRAKRPQFWRARIVSTLTRWIPQEGEADRKRGARLGIWRRVRSRAQAYRPSVFCFRAARSSLLSLTTATPVRGPNSVRRLFLRARSARSGWGSRQSAAA